MKKEQLNIALIQTSLDWENPAANRLNFETHFKRITKETDLIVLPEMFTTGFTMDPKSVAETMDGTTVNWLKEWASKLDVAICGSIAVTEESSYYNRFLFVKPSGSITGYDKRHTFNMAGEGDQYETGHEQVVIKYLGWKIFPQICYDLRFPVFSRNTMEYDLIIYVANWPKARIAAWDTLLKARAIENMSYCVGVNRLGTDGNNLEYVGHSVIHNCLGNPLTDINHEVGLISASLSKTHVTKIREKLPFLEDKDRFTLS